MMSEYNLEYIQKLRIHELRDFARQVGIASPTTMKKEDLISKEDAIEISKLIASHMGKWNVSNFSDVVLPIPSTSTEKFVHLVDFLGSRKCLEVDFNAGISY